MKIGFIQRTDANKKWGGDLTVIHSLMRGLNALNHETSLSTSPFAIPDADFFLFSNSTVAQEQSLEEIAITDKPFGVLGFHEDLLQYYMPATGFCKFVMGCLGYGLPTDNGIDYDLEMLFEMPHIVHYYGEAPKRPVLYNFQHMRKAKLWIANSSTEERTIQRDFPGSKPTVIPVAPGLVTGGHEDPDDSFLQLSGLPSKGYLLQVGRLEMRKNQLGTILATRDLDTPLVFIATLSPAYENLCFEAAAKWRRAPTLFIGQNIEERIEGAARAIPMPHGQKLPISTLLSAYKHAGLLIHPAFQELPGITYLEAAYLGTPAIASSWTTLSDYFLDPKLGHARLDGRIVYCEPHYLKEIERAVIENFGKSYAPFGHKTFCRTDQDAAKDLIEAIQGVS